MKKTLCCFLCVLSLSRAAAQRTEFMFGLNGGLNRILVGAVPNTARTGYSNAFSLSLIYKGPRSPFRFNPSVLFVTNSYQARASQSLYITCPQAFWRLSLQTGFPITKHLLFKAGFFMQVGMASNKYRLYVTQDGRRNYASSGYEELYDRYTPMHLQTGAQLGLMLTVGTRERFGFELQVQQFASPIVESDYYLTQKLENGDEKLLLGRNAKPTVLMFGVSYRIFAKRSPLPANTPPIADPYDDPARL